MWVGDEWKVGEDLVVFEVRVFEVRVLKVLLLVVFFGDAWMKRIHGF